MQQLATRPAQTALSTLPSKHLQCSLEELARLAECRQTSASAQTLEIYADELREFAEEDIREALRNLGRQARPNYETTFPSLGTVLQAVQSAEHARTRYYKRPFAETFVRCGAQHLLGDLVYLNAAGEACSRDEALEPMLQVCPCRRRWNDARSAHDRNEYEQEAAHNIEMDQERSMRFLAAGMMR